MLIEQRRVTLRMPAKLANALDQIAEREFTTVSAVIRRLVAAAVPHELDRPGGRSTRR